MRAGKLDKRVTLQHRVLTRNTLHEEVITFEDYATIWSGKGDLRGREYFAAQQVQSEVTTEFTIRFRDDVLVTDRIVDGDKNYNIRQIAEIRRHKGLVLMATAVQP